MSFPRAPLGSISIQAWALACGAFILLASDAIAAVVALVLTSTAQSQKTTGEPMKVKVPAESQAGAPKEEKKEL